MPDKFTVSDVNKLFRFQKGLAYSASGFLRLLFWWGDNLLVFLMIRNSR